MAKREKEEVEVVLDLVDVKIAFLFKHTYIYMYEYVRMNLEMLGFAWRNVMRRLREIKEMWGIKSRHFIKVACESNEFV